MIAIRIAPAGLLYAGLDGWEGDERETILPVVPSRPAYSREQAEREGLVLPEHATDADRELASLRRVRRMMRSLSEATWRDFLRESDEWACWAELEEWSELPRPGPRDGVPIEAAEWLVANGLGEWVEPDADELEAELARLLDEPAPE